MDYSQAKTIANLVNYLKDDEARSFYEQDEPTEHIYHDVLEARLIVLDFCELISGEGVYERRGRNPLIADKQIAELRDLVHIIEDDWTNPNICPSAPRPLVEGNTAHKWDEAAGYPLICSECGALKD